MLKSKLIKEVTYEGEKYFVFQTNYYDGKIAIILHPDEELYQHPDQIVMSVNLDDTELDEIAINDTDFYHGQYQFLINEGIIRGTGKVLRSGFNTYPVGKLIGNVNYNSEVEEVESDKKRYNW